MKEDAGHRNGHWNLSGSGNRFAGCHFRPAAEPLRFPLERTKARLDRGKYLVWAVTACFECHSEAHVSAPGALPHSGEIGAGSLAPVDGLPGKVVCSNITPDEETGTGKWSDQEFYEALTRGLGRDGRTLFPLMSYARYREMSDEDLAAIIVYIRSIPPIRNHLPWTELPEQVKVSLKPLPPKPLARIPDFSDPVRRGAYLANAADCAACHTPVDPQGRPLAGMEFAGGWRLKGRWGEVASANITTDPSGIPYYDQATFIDVMRSGRVRGVRELNSLMPWAYFRNMTDDDLKALFAWVRTLKPVAHRVDHPRSAGRAT